MEFTNLLKEDIDFDQDDLFVNNNCMGGTGSSDEDEIEE